MKEVRRAVQLRCSVCGVNGAAIGCDETNCECTYHYPCMVRVDAGVEFNVQNLTVRCRQHAGRWPATSAGRQPAASFHPHIATSRQRPASHVTSVVDASTLLLPKVLASLAKAAAALTSSPAVPAAAAPAPEAPSAALEADPARATAVRDAAAAVSLRGMATAAVSAPAAALAATVQSAASKLASARPMPAGTLPVAATAAVARAQAASGCMPAAAATAAPFKAAGGLAPAALTAVPGPVKPVHRSSPAAPPALAAPAARAAAMQPTAEAARGPAPAEPASRAGPAASALPESCNALAGDEALPAVTYKRRASGSADGLAVGAMYSDDYAYASTGEAHGPMAGASKRMRLPDEPGAAASAAGGAMRLAGSSATATAVAPPAGSDDASIAAATKHGGDGAADAGHALRNDSADPAAVPAVAVKPVPSCQLPEGAAAASTMQSPTMVRIDAATFRVLHCRMLSSSRMQPQRRGCYCTERSVAALHPTMPRVKFINL